MLVLVQLISPLIGIQLFFFRASSLRGTRALGVCAYPAPTWNHCTIHMGPAKKGPHRTLNPGNKSPRKDPPNITKLILGSVFSPNHFFRSPPPTSHNFVLFHWSTWFGSHVRFQGTSRLGESDFQKAFQFSREPFEGRKLSRTELKPGTLQKPVTQPNGYESSARYPLDILCIDTFVH